MKRSRRQQAQRAALDWAVDGRRQVSVVSERAEARLHGGVGSLAFRRARSPTTLRSFTGSSRRSWPNGRR